MKPLCFALLLSVFLVSACRHVPPAPRVTAPEQKCSSAAPDHIRRVQHLCEGEILVLPRNTFMNFDQDFRAQVNSGQPVNSAVIARFMTHRDTRILLRPRLIIADSEMGVVMADEPGAGDANTSSATLRAEFAPARQADGSVRLHVDISVPAQDQRGHTLVSNEKTHDVARIVEERVVLPSSDMYQVYRPASPVGARDVFVFLKLQTLSRP